MVIRVKLRKPRGKKRPVKYISETYPYREGALTLVDDVREATEYRTLLEFKVAWRILPLRKPYFSDEKQTIFKEHILGFEGVRFDRLWVEVDNVEYKMKVLTTTEKVSRDLYFNQDEFEMLKQCFVTSSHAPEDKDGNWLAFLKPKDNHKAVKIRYMKRGLTCMLSWCFKYRNSTIPCCYSFYRPRKKLLFNETMQKLYLSNYDQCDYFNVYPKES